jgi:hypothetical protein
VAELLLPTNWNMSKLTSAIVHYTNWLIIKHIICKKLCEKSPGRIASNCVSQTFFSLADAFWLRKIAADPRLAQVYIECPDDRN